jgi:hypothetical protein
MEKVLAKGLYSLYIWIAVSFLIKLVLERRLGFLKHYPYFNTPLIDLR